MDKDNKYKEADWDIFEGLMENILQPEAIAKIRKENDLQTAFHFLCVEFLQVKANAGMMKTLLQDCRIVLNEEENSVLVRKIDIWT